MGKRRKISESQTASCTPASPARSVLGGARVGGRGARHGGEGLAATPPSAAGALATRRVVHGLLMRPMLNQLTLAIQLHVPYTFNVLVAKRPGVRGRSSCRLERCQSGRLGRSRKPVWTQVHRGFESLPLRFSGACCFPQAHLFYALPSIGLLPLKG